MSAPGNKFLMSTPPEKDFTEDNGVKEYLQIPLFWTTNFANVFLCPSLWFWFYSILCVFFVLQHVDVLTYIFYIYCKVLICTGRFSKSKIQTIYRYIPGYDINKYFHSSTGTYIRKYNSNYGGGAGCGPLIKAKIEKIHEQKCEFTRRRSASTTYYLLL